MESVMQLEAAGVSLVVDVGAEVPRIVHWGAALGGDGHAVGEALRFTATPAILDNSPNTAREFTVWPSEYDAWSGTPALEGHAGGQATTPRPRLRDARLDSAEVGGRIRLEFDDDASGLRCTVVYTLDAAGVLAVDLGVERVADASAPPYSLTALTALMPVPAQASELLDFTGLWARERSPQRSRVLDGVHLRQVRRGKPGHDSPFVTLVGTPGFGSRHGEVWGVHLAWSGELRTVVERLPEGAGAARSAIGAGEVLRAGEIALGPAERYDAPTALFVWSDRGTDGIGDRFHEHLRARPGHPRSPRPLTLNSWEAVYFDHDQKRLFDLVDLGADIGVERFVLDDGWFLGRRNARAGLGDWVVDRAVWPNGLGPLVDRVRSRGMQFGLWFEPEMVNLDSELARDHPEWVLGPSEGLGPSSRHQYVLDLTRPEVVELLLERVDALVSEYRIDALKWDHNRDLLEAVSRRPDGDLPAVHRQTEALYGLLDELRHRHPALEIESCSAGGGRIDLGVLARTDRVWASDCNDPVERIPIERWTRLLLPPELIGSHVGGEVAHTSGRATDLPSRLIAALFAHAGIETDLTTCTPEELEALRSWAALYREFRPLLHGGRVVNADLDDPGLLLHGVVDNDRAGGLYAWVRLQTSPAAQAGRVRLPGLDPDRSYRVRVREDFGAARRHQAQDPEWIARAVRGAVELPGSVLAVAGVPLPTLEPQQAMLIEVVAA